MELSIQHVEINQAAEMFKLEKTQQRVELAILNA